MRLLSTISFFALILLLSSCGADNGVTTSRDLSTSEIPTAHKMELDDTQVRFPFGYNSGIIPIVTPRHPTSYNQTYFISVGDMVVGGNMTGVSNVIKVELSRRNSAPVEKMRVDFPHPNGLIDNEVVLCSVEYLENYNPTTKTYTRRLYGVDGVFLTDQKGNKREFYLDATFSNTHSIVDASDLLDITGTWRDVPVSVVLGQ